MKYVTTSHIEVKNGKEVKAEDRAYAYNYLIRQDYSDNTTEVTIVHSDNLINSYDLPDLLSSKIEADCVGYEMRLL